MRLVWDPDGKKIYETGVDQGVLFVAESDWYGKGEAWDGLKNVTETPGGEEPTPLFANNKKYGEITSAPTFNFTIEGYTSPVSFDSCDGTKQVKKGLFVTGQTRKKFALVYRTLIANDTSGDSYGYKLHIVYGAKAQPSEVQRTGINESVEALTLNWSCSTTPIDVPGLKPTAHIVIDSTLVDAADLKKVEDMVYGTDGVSATDSKLPKPAELIELITKSIV